MSRGRNQYVGGIPPDQRSHLDSAGASVSWEEDYGPRNPYFRELMPAFIFHRTSRRIFCFEMRIPPPSSL